MIVRTVAILGLPDMIVDVPELKVERGANGKPRWFRRLSAVDALGLPYEVEVDGFDQKARRPFPDAYQRRFLDPDPVPSLVNRARGELWRAAMDLLFEDLIGALSSIVLLPCAWPERPWEGSGPRILPDLNARRWQLDRPTPNRRVAARLRLEFGASSARLRRPKRFETPSHRPVRRGSSFRSHPSQCRDIIPRPGSGGNGSAAAPLARRAATRQDRESPWPAPTGPPSRGTWRSCWRRSSAR
jgi:hypothetical protein